MKTIIHLELSDVERNDLARRIDRDPVTKRLVTRKEITDLVLTLIQDEITTGWESTTDDRGPQLETKATPYKEDAKTQAIPFVPSRGDEDYLFKSKDPEWTRLCSAVLDATQELDGYVWQTMERNRK